PDEPSAGQQKIDRILSEHYAESAKKELIKSRIKEKGHYTLIGQLTVRLDQGKDHYWANVPALGDDTVRVSANVLASYSDLLLTSGAWGTMEIEYDATYEIKSRKYPFYIRDFTPLQYSRLKHVVFFDEIANTNFDDAEASISVLKDYMQTGKFSRGDQEFSAPCSIVLGGNIDTDVEKRAPAKHYRHLFSVLPQDLQDPAFLDRIHAYLPGWEVPKIQPENYATGYGFLT